jgi:hypothetical protein
MARVKTHCIEAFFISLENYQSVNVKNGLHEPFGHMQHKLWQKERPGVKLISHLTPQTLKVRNQPDCNACRWSATCHWKALNKNYKFALDLIPIRGLSKELCPRKVAGVQTGTISRLLLGSPGTKSHSDVSAAERLENIIWGKVVASPESRPW